MEPSKGKYNLTRAKKHINLVVSKRTFIMLTKGEHNKVYQGMDTETIKRLVKPEYYEMTPGELLRESQSKDIFRSDRDEYHFKEGYISSETKLIAEAKGVSINLGRAKYGEDPDKLFFVLKLGVKKLL